MPNINWQNETMPANAIPLQGSLFEENNEALEEVQASESSDEEGKHDLTDKELIEIANSKPRSKKHINKKESNYEELEENPQKSKPGRNSNVPAWAHHSEVELDQLTPVLRHYVELKLKNPERILLYRLGDFFECFFEDAINLSQLLELTLTGKEGGKAIGRVPMAGIPHHAAERYCSLLIQKGLSISICDQLESIQNKEGKLLKRGITRILTPGTVIEEGMLQAKKNNWLAAILIDFDSHREIFTWGLASADISTGEFVVKEGKGLGSLEQELLTLEAAEVICAELEVEIDKSWKYERIKLSQIPKTPFNLLEAEATLKKHFKLKTLNGLGLNESELALRSAGGLIDYLHETNPSNPGELITNISEIPLEFPQISFSQENLIIDAQTRRNLEITSTQRDGKFQGSLLWAIDRTLTAMGGRCLRRWIEAPLRNRNEIVARQDIVTIFVQKRSLRQSIRKLLRTMGDLERLAGRAGAGHAGPRELIAIADGLERLPRLALHIKSLPNKHLDWLIYLQDVDPKLISLAGEIKDCLIENPPITLTEGGIIHDGIDSILDGLRNQLDDQNQWLDSQEILERKISGNQNLRLQYHRTFGYFLSVSKSKSTNVPSHWIRRQTLANEERFITPDLKGREGKIFQLKARAANREYELFCKLREIVGSHAKSIRKAARGVAGLDILTGLAELAVINNYCPPEIINNQNKVTARKIHIEASRHPVVEQTLAEKNFQPNDVSLGINSDLIILTGPNASGKSCYLRQIGLIQLLVQIGSWIPAKKATVSIADQIFTRVGAVDDLAAGQSTFMVEMAETAYILNQATSQSLVLLDEIGRGTSTYDGLSIAWAVSEFLAKDIQSRTIFATHYHELNDLSKSINNVINFQVLVEENKDELNFLHKVAPGGANKSYGIEAARLAGVPKKVISKARKILDLMETKT